MWTFHQHEIGRKGQRAGRTGDRNLPVLQRLAQSFQRARAELGQLVQEEHPPVGQADLAGARPGPAADQPGVADGVVGRAKGAVQDEGRVRGQQPGDAIDLGHPQCLLDRHRWQDGGHRAGQQRLAGPGRAGHQDVVPPGRCHL